MKSTCLHCSEPITFRQGDITCNAAWRHDTDGTILRTREEYRTDWRGETAIAVLDDHYATPNHDS